MTKPAMIKTIQVRYVYLFPGDKAKVEAAIEQIGWPRNLILRQMVHGYFAKHRDYYVALGKMQAEARGMSEEDFFTCLLEDKAPTSYVGDSPQRPTPPYDGISIPTTDKENRYSTAALNLSSYNYVLLMLEQLVSQRSLPVLLSIIISQHIKEQWEKRYQPQIDMEHQRKFA